MALTKSGIELQQLNHSIQLEWLETNGLGGWAGSSLPGCNTRRYHALLMAATDPPTGRMNLVSKMDETIIIGGHQFDLGVNDYGSVIKPNGHTFLSRFSKGIFPEWIYELPGLTLNKIVFMPHGENTTIILYNVLKCEGLAELELLPLIAVRDYHKLVRSNEEVKSESIFRENILKINLYQNSPEIFIKVPPAVFEPKPNWYYDFHLALEKERGLELKEDLFSPGKFTLQIKAGDSFGMVISTEDPSRKKPFESYVKEKQRRTSLLVGHSKDETLRQLLLAADQFIVSRGEDGKTIIAGYHWFTDWSRDAMISFPGLCLSTGRFEDAKKVLMAFARHTSMGMLPNRFQDNHEPPQYNNVDGTLWYFIAVHKYLLATGDQQFVLEELLPVLKDIIDWHFKGTRYNIHVDDDGLLFAGETGSQLTWMDAKVGDWVVTPRIGKPVEIQALWYNALRIFANLLRLNKQEEDAQLVDLSAEKAKLSFNSMFWYGQGKYLYDLIDANNIPDASLRPNQLFAISLPFPLIEEKEKASSILAIVEEKLYTPIGLRSLSPDDPSYKGKYQGDRYSRDAAYHQGTVWSWLLGPYADAINKIEGHSTKLHSIGENIKYHLNEACIGSVSEIFDGDAPHHPRGCVAQAWGVAEVLRIIKEYGLLESTSKAGQEKINGVDHLQRIGN